MPLTGLILISIALLGASCTKKPAAEMGAERPASEVPQDQMHASLSVGSDDPAQFGANWKPSAIESAQLEALALEAPRFASLTELKPRGLKVFQSQCQSCHGADGRGGGPLADSLPVAPTNFHEWPIKYGKSLAEIALTVKLGRNDGAMPALGAQMSSEDFWAVVYLVHSWIDGRKTP